MIFPKVDISANEHEKTLSSQSLRFLFENAQHKKVVCSQVLVLKELFMHSWTCHSPTGHCVQHLGHTGGMGLSSCSQVIDGREKEVTQQSQHMYRCYGAEPGVHNRAQRSAPRRLLSWSRTMSPATIHRT